PTGRVPTARRLGAAPRPPSAGRSARPPAAQHRPAAPRCPVPGRRRVLRPTALPRPTVRRAAPGDGVRPGRRPSAWFAYAVLPRSEPRFRRAPWTSRAAGVWTTRAHDGPVEGPAPNRCSELRGARCEPPGDRHRQHSRPDVCADHGADLADFDLVQAEPSLQAASEFVGPLLAREVLHHDVGAVLTSLEPLTGNLAQP